jgi:hypothetical protein
VETPQGLTLIDVLRAQVRAEMGLAQPTERIPLAPS